MITNARSTDGVFSSDAYTGATDEVVVVTRLAKIVIVVGRYAEDNGPSLDHRLDVGMWW